MEDRGFDYLPLPYADDMQTELHRMLNPLNAEIGSRFGYHPAPFVEPVDPNSGSDEFLTALGGTEEDPDAGCAATAYEIAYASVNELIDRFQPLLYDLDDRVLAYRSSAEAKEAMRMWSECMSTAGYDYSSREEAEGAFTQSPDVTTLELEVRAADIECDRKLRITETRSKWERAKVEQWKADTAQEWDAIASDLADVNDELNRLAADEP
jgi:hypothetical protein